MVFSLRQVFGMAEASQAVIERLPPETASAMVAAIFLLQRAVRRCRRMFIRCCRQVARDYAEITQSRTATIAIRSWRYAGNG